VPLNEFTRPGYHIPRRDAVAISSLSNRLGVSGTAVAALGPMSLATAAETGILICRAVPTAAPKVVQACKTPIMAFALGAWICRNVSGTVKQAPRKFIRDRERIEEIRESAGRQLRRNTGSEIR